MNEQMTVSMFFAFKQSATVQVEFEHVDKFSNEDSNQMANVKRMIRNAAGGNFEHDN